MGWIRCTGIPGWNVCDISMADRSPRVRYLSHWKFIYAERYIGSILLSSCAHCSHKHMCVRRDRAHGWPRPLYSYSNRSTQTHIINMILFCFYALSLFLFFLYLFHFLLETNSRTSIQLCILLEAPPLAMRYACAVNTVDILIALFFIFLLLRRISFGDIVARRWSGSCSMEWENEQCILFAMHLFVLFSTYHAYQRS